MPDLKFTLSRNFGPNRTDTTTYLKADRKRDDELQHCRQQLWLGGPAVSPRLPRVATITRCDLSKVFQLNVDDRLLWLSNQDSSQSNARPQIGREEPY